MTPTLLKRFIRIARGHIAAHPGSTKKRKQEKHELKIDGTNI
jgi:hypothetical protein